MDFILQTRKRTSLLGGGYGTGCLFERKKGNKKKLIEE
jgi:hypothetical protein